MRVIWTPTPASGQGLERMELETDGARGRGGRLTTALAGCPWWPQAPSTVPVRAAEVRRLTRFWVERERTGAGRLLVG
jgi:hypothetical protein